MCALVPCSGTHTLPEAYIDDSRTSSSSNINELSQSADVRIDPIQQSNFDNKNVYNQAETGLRAKRLLESNDDSNTGNSFSTRRESVDFDTGNSNNNNRVGQRSQFTNRGGINSPTPQLNNLFPRLFSAVPVIPALLDSITRTFNTNGPRTGRQSNSRRNIRNAKPPVVYTQLGGVEGHYMGTMKGRKISG